MRQLVSLCVLCAVLVFASAQTISGQIAFEVSIEDRACSTSRDCTLVGQSCCFESNCRYAAVSLTAVAKYQSLLSSFLRENCTDNVCLGALCMQPILTCEASSGSTRTICSIGRPVVPTTATSTTAPTTTATPTTAECVSTPGPNCENVCTRPALEITPPVSRCLPDAVTDCVNKCKNTLATCSMTAATDPALGTATNARVCAYVARDQSLYNSCVDACRIPPPPPVDLTCSVVTGSRCQKECVADGVATTTAQIAPLDCTTPPEEITCFNECQSTAECKPTTLGCRFVPRDPAVYTECNKKCIAPNTPVCRHTGCSGEICSSVAMVSTCVFTCEARCYGAATCAGTADGTCAFSATPELEACLTSCKNTATPPPPPPTDVCKISGCERQLCVPASEPDLMCATIQIAEPTCENRCLQYAQCSSVTSVNDVTGANRPALCGWTPDPANPGAYGECLIKCRTQTNPCFVSGCGAVCSTAASLQPCAAAMIAPDCYTRCRIALSDCNMTTNGCLFVPREELKECIARCDGLTPTVVRTPVPNPECPQRVLASECLVDPCSVNKCPAHPDAACRADYCGGCNAIFYDKNTGEKVDCNEGCTGLRCNDCTGKPTCSFCSGEYASTAADGTTTTKQYGYCLAAEAAGAERCLASNARMLGPDSTCPIFAGDSTTVGSDDAIRPVQDSVSQSTDSVTTRFVIVVTLIVNETTNLREGFHTVRIFVDLIGAGAPGDTDRAEICSILKVALAKVDDRVAARANLDLECLLSERASLKRDASYVADLTFPASSNMQSSDSTFVAVSVVSMAAGIFASL